MRFAVFLHIGCKSTTAMAKLYRTRFVPISKFLKVAVIARSVIAVLAMAASLLAKTYPPLRKD